MLHSTGMQGVSWLGAAITAVPETSAAARDKELLMGAAAALAAAVAAPGGGGGAADSAERAFTAALEELADACRRSRRARAGAVSALLPPELLAADAGLLQ